MIEIKNNGNVVTLQENGEDYTQIILNKDLVVQPRETLCFDTKVSIQCQVDHEECWVYAEAITESNAGGTEIADASVLGILSQRIVKEDGEVNIELIGGYMSDEPLKLKKGTEIARIFRSMKDKGNFNKEELRYRTVFNDKGVIVKTSPEYMGNYDLVIEPEGQTYIKIHLP